MVSVFCENGEKTLECNYLKKSTVSTYFFLIAALPINRRMRLRKNEKKRSYIAPKIGIPVLFLVATHCDEFQKIMNCDFLEF